MSLMLHRIGLLRPSLSLPPASVPDAFEAEDWSIVPGDEEADVTISDLPDDGGDTITDIEYRLDGGSWVSSGGTLSFTISGLTNDQEYDVELRAVNSVGAGEAGDTKSVTPEGEGEDWHPNDLTNPPLAVWDPTVSGSLWQDTSAATAAGDGDPLGRIDDQSGNGNNALQTTSTKRPLLDIIDGKPWIVCDGVDDGMTFTNVKPAMVAAVYYIATAGNNWSLFVREELGVTAWNNIRLGSSEWKSERGASGNAADASDFCFNNGETRVNGEATAAYAATTPQIITVKAGTGGGQASEGLGAFGLPDFSGRQWRGRLGRIVLLSAVPDSGEYANLLAWLADPYGISL